ncbi:Hypothetical protein MVR_LOCUS29 [uncultured virus]|nr:Hypothetical protein MVR_LOCUS29 [uncultured virus]
MKSVVYALPRIDPIDPAAVKPIFAPTAPPRLIKYGFNNIGNQLDYLALTSNSFYKSGLQFDFSRTDSSSFTNQVAKQFHIKDAADITPAFTELWEILALFDLFKTLTTDVTYSSQAAPILSRIAATYLAMTKAKGKATHTITDSLKSKSLNTGCQLAVCWYADIDLDEGAQVLKLGLELPLVLEQLAIGSTLIIQFFSLNTQPSAEIIQLLASCFDGAFIVRPSTVSDLSNCKYLVLQGLRDPAPKLPPLATPDPSSSVAREVGIIQDRRLPALSLPDLYLQSLGLADPTISTSIQCINSFLVPYIYSRYNVIKAYLDLKVYEGATYQEFIQAQNTNTIDWLTTYANPIAVASTLDAHIKATDEACSPFSVQAGGNDLDY